MVMNIGWFSTGRDKAARDLFNSVYKEIRRGAIKADISFVFCNRVLGEDRESDSFIKMVKDYGINLISYSSRDFKSDMRLRGKKDFATFHLWRRDYDTEIMKRLRNYNSDLIVLAGYMLIVSGDMCEKFNMINLHPAAPGGPSGTWQEVIWKLIDSKANTTGVMMHLVTSHLDQGPPVTYCTFPIRGHLFDELWNDLYRRLKTTSLTQIIEKDGEKNQLFMEIRKHGFMRELPLLVQTIKAFADGRIKLENKRLFMQNETLEHGLCLNDEIEAFL
ncbi:MAG: formyltransferase family protein [Thermodesulfobacteriota bacterium]|nr:formyltransferase family protein [Thermodesulfobacteriota bacterium]